jgi:hypothetical protein
MVGAVEAGALVLAGVGLYLGWQIASSLRMITANAIGGLVVFLLANVAGVSVALSPAAIGVVLLAGVPEAALVLLLSTGGIAFVPPGAEEAGQIASVRMSTDSLVSARSSSSS